MKPGAGMTPERVREASKRFYEKLRENIERVGHSVISVFGDEQRPPFSYTVGLWEARLPELILVIGIEPQDALNAVNAVAGLLRRRERAFDQWQELDIGFNVPVRMHNPYDIELVRQEWTIQSGQFLRVQDYPVQQILFPDANGKWPDERGYQMKMQPLL